MKVDVLALSESEVVATAARLRPLGVRLLAEKVETIEVRDAARAAGYTLFQGYFFSKPAVVSARTIKPSPLAQMRLVAELNRPGTTLGELEDLIIHDAALSVRVLRGERGRDWHATAGALDSGSADTSGARPCSPMGVDLVAGEPQSGIAGNPDEHGGASQGLRAFGRAKRRPEAESSFFLLGLCSMLDVVLHRRWPARSNRCRSTRRYRRPARRPQPSPRRARRDPSLRTGRVGAGHDKAAAVGGDPALWRRPTRRPFPGPTN